MSDCRGMQVFPLTYVLITPARNEEAFIELTMKSVVNQTVRPVKWVIVSDGSTDSTDAIVKKYAAEHDWIELITMPERRERHFAGKVNAFNQELLNDPTPINLDPYGAGWLFEMQGDPIPTLSVTEYHQFLTENWEKTQRLIKGKINTED